MKADMAWTIVAITDMATAIPISTVKQHVCNSQQHSCKIFGIACS